MENPKSQPRDNTRRDNTEKNPDDWVSGDEPMTGAQASYLKTLSEQAHEPSTFNERLTKAQASKEIDRLKEKVGLGEPDE
jgi:hypothetical protein